MKVVCVNIDRSHPAAVHFLKEGETYTVEETRTDDEGQNPAYVLEEIPETCPCCDERQCFKVEQFIPIQSIEEVIENEEENS